MTIEMIAFDADDTLWHTEVIFKRAQQQLNEILAAWAEPELVQRTLSKIEIGNIAHYGYGYKSYTLSMIEAAIALSDGTLTGKSIKDILALGHEMLSADVNLITGVKETLEQLGENYPLMIITKGDLLEQTSKVKRSGLTRYFSVIEVVSSKSVKAYQEILNKLNLDPGRFVMVGNSLPSDIQPVLDLGGVGIHIPADTTWSHEIMDDFNTSQPNFYELETIKDLTGFLTTLDQKDLTS